MHVTRLCISNGTVSPLSRCDIFQLEKHLSESSGIRMVVNFWTTLAYEMAARLREFNFIYLFTSL